jgi:hypothetical protein
MNNNVRVHNAVPYLKNTVNNLVRLQVSGNGYTDDAVIRFLPDATAEFDGAYDAHKLFGEVSASAQLYTFGTTPLAINALPETDVVQIGLHVGSEGVYTIAATEMNDLPSVTLEDTKTGIFTDLLKGSYSFTSMQDENEQRFLLHFSPVAINELANTFANIYSTSRVVYIDLEDNIQGDILIYNISGQIVTTVPKAMGRTKISLSTTGNYIVKIISDKSTMVKKVFIQ